MSFTIESVFDTKQPVHARAMMYMLHAPALCLFLNQVMCGTEQECIDMVRRYGGTDEFGREIYQVSHYIIRNSRHESVQQGQAQQEPQIAGHLD